MRNLAFITKNYTSFLLTVIAFLLLVIVLRDIPLIPEVKAGDDFSDSTLHQTYGLVPINPDGSIDVRVVGTSNVIEVDIKEISTYDEMPVNIEELNGSSVYNALPVEVRD